MLRFIKHNLTSIDGVSIYPIISLLIFFLFFAFMLTYVIRMKKKEVNEDSKERTRAIGNLIRLRNLTEQRNRKKDN